MPHLFSRQIRLVPCAICGEWFITALPLSEFCSSCSTADRKELVLVTRFMLPSRLSRLFLNPRVTVPDVALTGVV